MSTWCSVNIHLNFEMYPVFYQISLNHKDVGIKNNLTEDTFIIKTRRRPTWREKISCLRKCAYHSIFLYYNRSETATKVVQIKRLTATLDSTTAEHNVSTKLLPILNKSFHFVSYILSTAERIDFWLNTLFNKLLIKSARDQCAT